MSELLLRDGELSELTLPSSVEPARRVLSAGLQRLLRDLRGVPLERRVLKRVRDLLASEPGRVFAALRRPTVGAMVRVARTGTSVPGLSDVLAAELAMEVDASTPCLSARHPAQAFHPIAEGLVLATVDVNPLALTETHPDKDGNAVDLGGRSPSTWVDALREALSLVEAHLPVVREEIDLVIQQILPVGYDAERHLSASYAEAIGSIYLTLHPNPMTMAEALVHEHQHNKLNALMELGPILENAPSERYASPVRPDPRPLHGILLAVHAFLAVEALYRARLAAGDNHLETRYLALVRINREGAAVLAEHARPSALGRGLLDEIARLCA